MEKVDGAGLLLALAVTRRRVLAVLDDEVDLLLRLAVAVPLQDVQGSVGIANLGVYGYKCRSATLSDESEVALIPVAPSGSHEASSGYIAPLAA